MDRSIVCRRKGQLAYATLTHDPHIYAATLCIDTVHIHSGNSAQYTEAETETETETETLHLP